ncbi:MAG: chemotaxis protein CheA [Bacteroidota bacterium]
MDATRITYIEEANELLSNLEIALLSLETDGSDKSHIEAIFRVMHTLKGNSSMFGLAKIAEFVHDLETIYDKIRIGEMQLSKNLIDCTFLCLDHLKNIIGDSELNEPANNENHQKLISQINGFINSTTGSAEAIAPTVEEKHRRSYHIYFEPGESVFNNGTNPLFLLSELATFGNCRQVAHFKDVVSFEEFNSSTCITFWDIFLETEKTANEIKDVFVFVEDNSKIEITDLSGGSYLSDKDFLNYISLTGGTAKKVDMTGFKPKDTEKQAEIIAGDKPQLTLAKKNDSKEKNVSSIRVSSDKLDELMNLVSELVTTQAGLTLYTENNRNSELETISENIEKLSRRLRDMAFGMTLVPINNLFGRFQRMVRDVSNTLGKEIEFITEGGETELDKTIIETLTDPLMHILRNSLDHGIEKPGDRLAKGKEKSGKLTLKAYYSGVFVYIQIKDDGKGIDVNAVRKKAISKGLVKEEDNLSDKQLFDFIFHPGFSTAEKVTDVSGRGVGMDVVNRNIQEIKGSIEVDSRVDEGTTLTIKIPLTLSIIDGLLVTVESVNYIIPLSVITKCYEVNNTEMLGNFNRLLILDDEQVPFINLREEFGHRMDAKQNSQIIVVNNGERKVGISIDQIIGEYQAVVKPLGKFYKQQDFISGASILGDGTIALVLDTNKMVELYTKNIKINDKKWQLN